VNENANLTIETRLQSESIWLKRFTCGAHAYESRQPHL